MRAPRREGEGYTEYAVPLEGELSDMADFPLAQRVHYWVGTSEDDCVIVPINIHDRERGGAEYRATHALPFRNGEVTVWSKIIEYKQAEREPFFIETVATLTRNIEAHVTAQGRQLRFDGSIFAYGGANTVNHHVNGITLTYPGWLYEDQGYLVWWWQHDSREDAIEDD